MVTIITVCWALIGNTPRRMSQNTVSSDQIWEAFREHRKESERHLLEAFLKAETAEKDDGESQNVQDQLVAAEKRRSLPLELLAEEWLKEECGDIATKTYLMDKLLPTLILGLEKLLTEVSMQRSVSARQNPVLIFSLSMSLPLSLLPGIREEAGRYGDKSV